MELNERLKAVKAHWKSISAAIAVFIGGAVEVLLGWQELFQTASQ